MPPHEYGFEERMTMSSGLSANTDVSRVLLEQIPGAVNATQAASVNDRQGVDWWVELSTARHLGIDAKVREEDWAPKGKDDLALETWSVVEKNVIGWTRDANKRCDYILWLWKDTGRFCLIPFPMLCRVFELNWSAWAHKYQLNQQYTKRQNGGYHSECVFVPRRDVWAEIYRVFGGNGRLEVKAA